MSLFITSLNSGSNGNCYYIGNDKEAVLIDAGIPCREIEKRMKRLQLSMNRVKAVFVSHEHSDHIRGIPVLANKWRLPVFTTPGILQYCNFSLKAQQLEVFQAFQPVRIGTLHVTAFPKLHDAAEPYSFVVAGNKVKVGVFTDIGTPCDQVTHYFRQCHAAFLEANYDEELLEKGNYPLFLKNRIRGGKGHLSNKQALQVFSDFKSPHLSHLILSHLSKENNCPSLVYDLFSRQGDGVHISVASRFEETPVYRISGKKKDSGSPAETKNGAVQLSLF